MLDRAKTTTGLRPRAKQPADTAGDLASVLSAKVVGQPDVIGQIVPYVEMFQAGLNPENRPVGVFLLLGPTGTGKTRTVEALAEALHGSHKNILKIDCGEFQMEHEVAKLIGAPPGYLGHRETQPMLSQQKLTAVATERCGLSLVLFDEIEKAAPSMARLLLGILDRGVLRLGDNSAVNFEKAIIFLTSNLGAKEMMRELQPDFGFQSAVPGSAYGPNPVAEVSKKLQGIAVNSVKRKVSPEFVNRIDHVVTYQPLSATAFSAIADLEIGKLQKHIHSRLGDRGFELEVPYAARQWLIARGTSTEYGARELKRTLHRHLTQPMASMVARGEVPPGGRVRVDVAKDGESLALRVAGATEAPAPTQPTVLLVDDNRDFLKFLERQLAESKLDLVAAETVAEARRLAAKRKPAAALIDYTLVGGTGVDLAQTIRKAQPRMQILIMTSVDLAVEDEAVCEEHGFPVLRKPFLAGDALNLIRRKLGREG
jgi:ATP-dependent Clp protease ATP-binding subunit ClpA